MSMPSTDTGLSAAMSAVPAASALTCTGFCLSATSAKMVGMTVTMYGSTQNTPDSLAQFARSVIAHIAASLVALSSAALLMAMQTALAEVLSVLESRPTAVSPHASVSGSLDMLSEGSVWRARR